MSPRIASSDVSAARERNEKRLARAVLIAVLVGVAVDAVIVVLAVLLGDDEAVLSALFGTALAVVVTLPTPVSARLIARREALTGAMIVAGTWLVKMLALIIALSAVRDLGFFVPGWTGVALLGGAVAAAVIEALLLMRRRADLETDPV